jgi:hypothetical protein
MSESSDDYGTVTPNPDSISYSDNGEHGSSEVIGVVLILGRVTLGVAAITLFGGQALSESQNHAEVSVTFS